MIISSNTEYVAEGSNWIKTGGLNCSQDPATKILIEKKIKGLANWNVMHNNSQNTNHMDTHRDQNKHINQLKSS